MTDKCNACHKSFWSRDGLCLGDCAGDIRSPFWPENLVRHAGFVPKKPKNDIVRRNAEKYYDERGEVAPWNVKKRRSA